MSEPSPTVQRIAALFIALLLGKAFVVDVIEQCRAYYWLLTDGQETIGVVTLDRGHGVVGYDYRVSDTKYQGADHRSLRSPQYANVTVGEHTVVHFSASHPWLSSIDLPTIVLPAGWPLILFIWFVEARLIGTIVMPGSKWALKMTGKNAFSLRSDRKPSSRRIE